MEIIHLKHSQIDKFKWDRTIQTSINRRVYAFSWYLDVVNPKWEALVTEDYQFIMPLTITKKGVVKAVISPMLTQQLGIFSNIPISDNLTKLFISSIPYKIYSIQLNSGNKGNGTMRTNFELFLGCPYQTLYNKFSKNIKRNLAKGYPEITIRKEIEVNEFLEFLNKHSIFYNSKTFSKLKELFKINEFSSRCIIYSAYLNNTLVAASLFLNFENRFYYLAPATSSLGKQNNCGILIVNKFIEDNAEVDCILDFEGSNIPNVAHFYKSWGAIDVPYEKIESKLFQYLSYFKTRFKT